MFLHDRRSCTNLAVKFSIRVTKEKNKYLERENKDQKLVFNLITKVKIEGSLLFSVNCIGSDTNIKAETPTVKLI
jgi:hypothetical protein